MICIWWQCDVFKNNIIYIMHAHCTIKFLLCFCLCLNLYIAANIRQILPLDFSEIQYIKRFFIFNVIWDFLINIICKNWKMLYIYIIGQALLNSKFGHYQVFMFQTICQEIPDYITIFIFDIILWSFLLCLNFLIEDTFDPQRNLSFYIVANTAHSSMTMSVIWCYFLPCKFLITVLINLHKSTCCVYWPHFSLQNSWYGYNYRFLIFDIYSLCLVKLFFCEFVAVNLHTFLLCQTFLIFSMSMISM